jgi:hypothetical protein
VGVLVISPRYRATRGSPESAARQTGSIEVLQQGDLGTEVDHLAMEMQDQHCHRFGLEARFATPLSQAVGIELADAGNPQRILPVECNQSQISRSWVVVRLIADGRPVAGRSWLSQCRESWVLTSASQSWFRGVASVVTSLPWHPPQTEGGWHLASAGGQRCYWRTVLA